MRYTFMPSPRLSARALCGAAVLACTAAPTGAEPSLHAYRIDPAATHVSARVAFLGLASKSAQFPGVSGAVSLQPRQPDSIALDIVLDARQLTADDRVTIARLKSRAFFDVDRYPTIRFAGNHLVMRTPVTADVVGTITARGVTRPARLGVTFAFPPSQESGTRPIALSARTTIDRRDFGMTAWSLIVGRRVTITINARLQPG